MSELYNSQFVEAPEKRFSELIVFVHHFGGDHRSSRLHQKFVAELGFDSLAFDLLYHDVSRVPLKVSSVTDALEGFRHRWAQQIEDVLREWDRPKIIYSFSMPSSSAAEALADAETRKEVRAWICEGGPFLRNLQCFWNYFTKAAPVKNPLLRASFAASTLALIGNFTLRRDLKNYLSSLPGDFPILNIRAWQDALVPVAAIDEVFEEHKHLDLEILSLPEAGHIKGLSEAPSEYKPRVERFLKRVATLASDNADAVAAQSAT